MPDIAKLATDLIRVVNPEDAEILPAIAGVTVAPGDAAYCIAASGKYGLANANAAGRQQARGLFMEKAGDGQGVRLLKRGKVAGYDIAALNYDDPVFLSDTAGAFSTTAGTMSVQCGRIAPLSDRDRTKVIYFEFDWLRTWA